MTRLRQFVLGSVVGLLLLWAGWNIRSLAPDQDGVIRLVLGVVLALLVLLRRKADGAAGAVPGWAIPVAGCGGAVLALAGLVFRVRQFEWVGLILLLAGCLLWAVPRRYSRDAVLALFIFYWVHPLPGQVLGAFQMVMQQFAVAASEWVLQACNVRVWADGLALTLGGDYFEVPAACSGMRTATTMVLYVLGVGVLFRLRWLELFAFLVLGVLQVLLLNVLRIALTVLWSDSLGTEWVAIFLHDTLGLFLLAAIFLVQGELLLWRRVWRGAQDVHDRMLSALADGRSPAWRGFVRWTWAGLVLVLLVTGAGVAIFKNRPYHRGLMIGGVVDRLGKDRPEAARRAVNEALVLAPDEEDLKIKRVQVLLRLGDYSEALSKANRLQRDGPLHVVLKTWALMGLGRAGEALSLIAELTEEEKELPGVSIVLAECAAMRADTPAVVENILKARVWQVLAPRVYALFPYLAAREQWGTIAQCKMPEPHVDPVQAVIAVCAHLRMDELSNAWDILKEASSRWPEDPIFLRYLTALAVARQGGRWEDLFAERLKGSLDKVGVDELAVLADNSFVLCRPDLAWLAYRRLERLDPADPALFLLPAQYGDVWFTFRKQRVGLVANNPLETVDRAGWYLERLRTQDVPLAKELTTGDLKKTKAGYLEQCLAELARREAAGRLTPRMQMMYPSVLAMAGRYKEAHARLTALERQVPGRRASLQLEHAFLYEKECAWESLYETTRELIANKELGAQFLLASLQIRALMHLDLGAYALAVAKVAEREFPRDTRVNSLLAALWFTFGAHEEALFALTSRDERVEPLLTAELLANTGRWIEARQFRKVHGMPEDDRAARARQAVLLPQAEYALKGVWGAPLSVVEMEAEGRKLEAGEQGVAVSPFVRGLRQRIADWYRNAGAAPYSSVESWVSVGRDQVEQGLALNELGLLLARQGATGAACVVLAKATELAPGCPVPWRAWVALSDGDPGVIAKARQACPSDPELWLASLVARTRVDGPGAWSRVEIEKALAERRYSPGTLVRAGDFLMRKAMADTALLAADYAMDQGRGLLPAYLLGIRCALATGARSKAAVYAVKAAELAMDPVPFHKVVAALAGPTRGADKDAVAALERMVEAEPDDGAAVQKLGSAYLEKGEAARASHMLDAFLSKRKGDVSLSVLALTAEAARRTGEQARSVRLLAETWKANPGDWALLNNLVFTLAMDQQTLPEARRLLPQLLRAKGDAVVVLDTAAVVSRNSGNLDEARGYLQKALERVDEADVPWLRMNPTCVDLDVYKGKYDDRVDAGLSDFDRFKLASKREDLIPLAEELARKLRERAARDL